ncbi:histidine protein methyltransferase 1 homolog [Hyla sarda]|uniref:histidine protein methyltransferase 1 homolog n=1 Tax=Hyla sarda TaxID=327740 RepID=UPI0024C3C351|nr:histidine protein methyltransferase 1 homolog [Hyla sarda]XP_056424869.1 histidine protein methyltransferase 1 homolog [Hyla sarda]XP_056424870.1 histidine protein methyltransferase 1 homolog [Hyla sarda]
MSFQFNFNIEERESSPGECEISLSKHTPTIPDKDVQPEDFNDLNRSSQKECVDNNECESNANSIASNKTLFCKPAAEHQIPEDVCSVLENKIVESSLGLQFVNVSVVEKTLSDSDVYGEDIVNKSITSNSDLISGVYEGGMKIWECTFDLIRYLEDKAVNFEDKAVLDLGCGAGLLGIFSLKQNSKVVHFQDYNSTVVEEITIPNALVNCDSNDLTNNINEPSGKRIKKSDAKPGLLTKCRFFSGEWSQFTQLMKNQEPPMKYNVILTSETIYNPTYYNALHEVFRNLLADDGIVYLASKSHYFGVGGGVHLFETFIKENKVFDIHTLKVHNDGLQRMLLSLVFTHS